MVDNAAFPSVMAPYVPLPPLSGDRGKTGQAEKGRFIPHGEISARLFPYQSNEFLFLFKKRMAVRRPRYRLLCGDCEFCMGACGKAVDAQSAAGREQECSSAMEG